MKPLNEGAAAKIRATALIVITVPLNSISSLANSFTVSLCAFCFCRLVGKDRFGAASGVEHAQHNVDQLRFRRAAFYSQLKSKVGNILAEATALRINLNIDGAPIASRTPTHPSHSQALASSPLPSP